ncbi:MAG TPA: hypothetical protein VKB57_26075 [Acidimicrobiales bacterium]|nr:hypothetical protein [Acidimicrobiales bacterium]
MDPHGRESVRYPGPPSLDLAGSQAPEFPVAAAEELDRGLIDLAAKLELAKTDRTRAERNLTEFKGTVAEQYRADLARHVGHLNDTIELLQHTVGLLRDAIRDHESAVARHQRLGMPPAG